MSFAAEYPACSSPCQRFAVALADANASLGAGVGRWPFTVRLFHSQHLAGLTRHTRRTAMPTMEEYAKQPAAERMKRLARTGDELAATIKGRDEAVLARRPDAKNWAAKECVCHLRDTEELFKARFDLIMAMENPKLSFDPATPDRWAAERQYLRHDVQQALAHFRKRRAESLAFLETLTPEQWKRGGTHATRGLMTIDDFVTLIAWHDDNRSEEHTSELQSRLHLVCRLLLEKK